MYCKTYHDNMEIRRQRPRNCSERSPPLWGLSHYRPHAPCELTLWGETSRHSLHHRPSTPWEGAWWHETRHYCAPECMTSIVDYSFACGVTERNMGQSLYLWFDSAGFCVGTRHGPALFCADNNAGAQRYLFSGRFQISGDCGTQLLRAAAPGESGGCRHY